VKKEEPMLRVTRQMRCGLLLALAGLIPAGLAGCSSPKPVGTTSNLRDTGAAANYTGATAPTGQSRTKLMREEMQRIHGRRSR
jgi:hypothetical protein